MDLLPETLAPPRDGEVHLWLLEPAAVSATLRATLAASLSPDEHARAARFHFERDRTLFILGRGLVRRLLGSARAAPPASLVFEHGPHGKPLLRGEGPCFNVSHTEGMVAVALSRHPVGVDVERFRRNLDLLAIAQQVFSASERAALEQLQDEARLAYFARVWTLKEAIIKATGEGMSAALQQLTLDLSCPEQPRIASSSEPWRLASFTASAGIWAAVATRTDAPLVLVRKA